MAKPEPLASSMRGALKGLRLDVRMREARAMALWPDIVGETTSTKTRPLYVHRGTMVVGVSSSAWANQLNLLKPHLLEKLAERVGSGVIRDLRWKSGPVEDVLPERPGAAPSERRGAAAGEAPPLSADEAQAIERLAVQIPDPDLAALISRTLASQAQRRHRQRAAGWAPCKRCGVLYDPEDRPVVRPADEASARPADALDDPLALAPLCPVCRGEVQQILA